MARCEQQPGGLGSANTQGQVAGAARSAEVYVKAVEKTGLSEETFAPGRKPCEPGVHLIGEEWAARAPDRHRYHVIVQLGHLSTRAVKPRGRASAPVYAELLGQTEVEDAVVRAGVKQPEQSRGSPVVPSQAERHHGSLNRAAGWECPAGLSLELVEVERE